MRKLLLLAALATALALGVWWWLQRPLPVTTAVIARGSAAEVIYATGLVEPDRWAEVTSLARARIVDTCRCEGRFVELGAVLFRLDDSAAMAHVAELEAQLDLARKDLQRASDLQRRGIATEERVDQATAAVSQHSAAVTRARSELRDYVIVAPMAGQVLRLDGEIGEVVTPGEPLAWVGQPQPLLVNASVNEEDIPRVALGQRALLKADAFPGRPLDATVHAITPMGDPELKTYRVRLALPDDTPLFIGMSVEVNILVRTVEATLLAPAPAVVEGAVFVLGPDGRARRQPVATGIVGAEAVEITGGVEAGATVVSPVPAGLGDGARIAVRGPG
ncbi:MAG: efflux RND transporter periplasmic adaptor subunit [Geminicoccaceae bacterium]|jgi:RND family efflux transporter MFP subunit|nr:efflux RND transporter periplasmic adaptor subunit [Geminicoccaceae bacterium]MCB9966336.1 efflux RND transporter periplasmic adaptor subunit [Geminicoccaceae bacterium]HRY25601.1 efflux RND transporter periplasmic adaptor subunit [Geminicoccaceae bacterium]